MDVRAGVLTEKQHLNDEKKKKKCCWCNLLNFIDPKNSDMKILCCWWKFINFAENFICHWLPNSFHLFESTEVGQFSNILKPALVFVSMVKSFFLWWAVRSFSQAVLISDTSCFKSDIISFRPSMWQKIPKRHPCSTSVLMLLLCNHGDDLYCGFVFSRQYWMMPLCCLS